MWVVRELDNSLWIYDKLPYKHVRLPKRICVGHEYNGHGSFDPEYDLDLDNRESIWNGYKNPYKDFYSECELNNKYKINETLFQNVTWETGAFNLVTANFWNKEEENNNTIKYYNE